MENMRDSSVNCVLLWTICYFSRTFADHDKNYDNIDIDNYDNINIDKINIAIKDVRQTMIKTMYNNEIEI